jgi:hypothetical protein
MIVEDIQKEQINSLYHNAIKQSLQAPTFSQFSTPLRNELFVGRSIELEKMHRCLLYYQHSSNVTSCALPRVAGVGKTDTALEYCHLYQSEYDAVFWIPAESDLTLKSAFGEISRSLGLFANDNPPN